MESKRSSLLVVGAIFVAGALTACDSVGFGNKIPKCDDPQALELTGKLALPTAIIEDNTLGGWERVSELMRNNPTLIATEMILNQGVDKDIGRNSCVASFVFSSSNIQLTEHTCKFVTRAEYSLQYDTTGKLVSTVTKQSPLSCVKFTRQEIEGRNSNLTDPARQIELGLKYERGDGVPQDYAEAAKWYRKAAEQGEPTAQYYFGRLYFDGNGVPQDYSEAAKWIRKSADQGNDIAQSFLGDMYEEGKGVPQDYVAAARWYRLAANQGEDSAKISLGVLYSYGRGIPRDIATARQWWMKVSAADFPRAAVNAAYNLGESFYAGAEFGATDDVEEARRHWTEVLRSTDGKESYRKLAAAGIHCIEEGLSSRECSPLRCSIEGRQNCPEP